MFVRSCTLDSSCRSLSRILITFLWFVPWCKRVIQLLKLRGSFLGILLTVPEWVWSEVSHCWMYFGGRMTCMIESPSPSPGSFLRPSLMCHSVSSSFSLCSPCCICSLLVSLYCFDWPPIWFRLLISFLFSTSSSFSPHYSFHEFVCLFSVLIMLCVFSMVFHAWFVWSRLLDIFCLFPSESLSF